MRIAIVIFALFALACSKKEVPPPAEAAPAAEAESPEVENVEAADESAQNPAEMLEQAEEELPPELQGDTPLVVGAPPVIKLIEAGAEPRAPLRFAVAPGAEQEAKFDVGFDLEAVVLLMHIHNPNYVVSFDLSLRPGKVRKDGSTRVELQVRDANVDFKTVGSKKRVQALTSALEGARKLRGSYTLGARGQIGDLEIRVPKGAVQESHDMADSLRLAILQTTPALPEEPVGPGAKWSAHQSIEQGGARVNQLRTFELVSVKDGAAVLGVELRQTATEQRFETPGKPMPLDLQVLRGSGSGTLTWDFTKLTPRAADLESTVLQGIRQEIKKDGVPTPADSAVQTIRSVRIGATE